MKTVWMLVAMLATGCFSEPGFAPRDVGASDVAEEQEIGVAPDLGSDVGEPAPGLQVEVRDLARPEPGGRVDVRVRIVRGDIEGLVDLTAVGLPNGVTGSGTVPAGDSDGILEVTATTAAEVGGPLTGEVVASIGEVERRAPLQVVVAGPAGSVDTSFGVNGATGVAAAAGDDTVSSIVLDEQGRILVAGRSAGATTTGYVLALQNDGNLDRSFGSNGVFTGFGGASSDVLGGAYADGFALNARIDGAPTLLRLGPDGALDDDWGTAALAVGARGPVAKDRDLVIYADDQIYVFADAGLPTQFGAPAPISALAVDLEDRFLVGQAGTTVVSRLTEQGALDTEFGAGGSLQIGGNFAINAVAPAPGGSFASAVGTTSVVARFDDRGRLDPDFGGDGAVDIADEPYALLGMLDGVFVAADRGSSQVVLRLGADGGRDATFANAGEVVVNDATGPVTLHHDSVAGRLLMAFPVGAAVEIRRFWLAAR